MSLTNKVIVGLLLGAATGAILNFLDNSFLNNYVVDGAMYAGGKLFVNALKMLVVPLVIFSLIPGVFAIGDIKLLGKVGTKSIILYIATTAIAIATAISLAALFGIGSGGTPPEDIEFVGRSADKSTLDILIGIVPTNIFKAFASGDMLAIIFFSIFFGIAALSIKDQIKETISLIDQLNKIVMQMVEMVMWFAPYAVFCLIGKAIADVGPQLLIDLAGYFSVVVGALLFHAFITQMLILKTFTGMSIGLFLSKIRNAQLFAFSTSSSGATIPVTLRTVQERLGVDRAISSFSVPFGATINMDGTAIMQGVATVFIANLYGIDLGIMGYVIVVLTAVLASIGTAAVPSVGLVMLTLVFEQVNLPVEAIGLIMGVDRLLDMTRTAVNVTGDTVVTSIVAKSEGKLDMDVFNDPEAGQLDDIHLPKS
ncbi:MAG: dicarboxylate/amino acid:cation symporter [Gammaproteobacteria bacterium]|nr:dicarboxylate/amino acid:cation symporter [Gammaproteobacteria bacterium]